MSHQAICDAIVATPFSPTLAPLIDALGAEPDFISSCIVVRVLTKGGVLVEKRVASSFLVMLARNDPTKFVATVHQMVEDAVRASLGEPLSPPAPTYRLVEVVEGATRYTRLEPT